MRFRELTLFSLLLLLFAISANAAEHNVEAIKEGPPADELSKEIAAQIAPTGFQVTRGSSTVCQVWFCKQWTVTPGFNPTGEILYPFQPGQLIGVVQFPRDFDDFRGQEVDDGVYTMRYALQPIDGNHIGTSPTRDFFLLVSADEDESPDPMDYNKLVELSALAANSTHPAMICLQRPGTGGDLAIHHNEDRDWWIVTAQGNARSDDTVSKLTIEMVVVGTSPE